MGLAFKRIVLGDLASVLNENGHSFHLKYWIYTMSHSTKLGIMTEKEGNKLIAQHAQLSELTTGNSQLDFISSIPPDELQSLVRIGHTFNGATASFLAFAVSYGLALCLRDWIAKHSGELEGIYLPLMSLLISTSESGVVRDGYLTIARTLLDNGYSIKQDPGFFNTLFGLIQTTGSGHPKEPGVHLVRKIPEKTLHELVTLVLEDGQDPNTMISPFKFFNRYRSLHIANPSVAAELVRHGADPNALDWKDRTPLDWVLEFPSELSALKPNCELRYKMCNILIKAGGLTSQRRAKAWTDILAEFEKEGYDITALREYARTQRNKAWENPLSKLLNRT